MPGKSKTAARKKSKKKKTTPKQDPWITRKGDRVTVELSTGYEVECMPIADQLDEAGAGIEEPDVPTYVIEDYAGAELEQSYSDEHFKADGTPKNKDMPEEDLVAWIEYKTEMLRIERQREKLRARLIAVRGIKTINPPPEEEWIAEHEFVGLSVPSHPDDPDLEKRERLVHFVNNDVIRTLDDGYRVTAGIYAASGLNEEVLAELEASFRAEMGRQKAQAAALFREAIAQQKAEEASGPVVGQPELGTDRDADPGGDKAG